jgi:hypothetical protein
MALIINAWNVSAGDKSSDAVVTVDNLHIAWKTTGATDPLQMIQLQVTEKVEGEDHHLAKDDRGSGKDIILLIKGNVSDSRNIIGINAASVIVEAIVPAGSVGALNVWAVKH